MYGDCVELDQEIEKLLCDRKLAKAENLARLKMRKFNNPKIHYSLAITLATIGFLQNIDLKKKQAKKYYGKIIERFPNTMHAYLSEARLQEESYNLKNALPFYKKAFSKCRTGRNAVHIGNVYRQLKKIALAKRYYLIAEKLEKGSAAHHLKSLLKEKKTR